MMLDFDENYTYQNIEPVKEFFQRIYNFLDDIIEKYKGKRIILVTHGGVSQPIDCYFNGMPNNPNYESFEQLTLKNCEVKKYTVREKEDRER